MKKLLIAGRQDFGFTICYNAVSDQMDIVDRTSDNLTTEEEEKLAKAKDSILEVVKSRAKRDGSTVEVSIKLKKNSEGIYHCIFDSAEYYELL